MKSTTVCPECGNELPDHDLGDLCPDCLLALGLGPASTTEIRTGVQVRDGDAHPPERIGPYRILRLLGEGGMGIVYLAEQERPIRRKVALKRVKLGMDTRQVLARFDSERQALALMNHPHVAQVYDAGRAEDGRPYFVMEYVAGVPIT